MGAGDKENTVNIDDNFPFDQGNPLSLSPQKVVGAVEKSSAVKMVPVDESKRAAFRSKARDFADSLDNLLPGTSEFERKVFDLTHMADDTIRKSSSSSNGMLQRPLRVLSSDDPNSDLTTPQSRASSALQRLRSLVEDLTPKESDFKARAKRFLWFIPYGKKRVRYFDKYASSQAEIDTVISSIRSARYELLKDNASIDGERVMMWSFMKKLQEYVVLSEELESAISDKVSEISSRDRDLGEKISKELLFAARQKHTDLLTQLAVLMQGYMALGMIRKNNDELIRGADRAANTTVGALRTAVIVANALQGQKLVLDQIDSLNDAASEVVAGTSKVLKNQGNEVDSGALGRQVSIDTLRKAFSNIYETMENIEDFKGQANDNLRFTVLSLQEEINHAQSMIEG